MRASLLRILSLVRKEFLALVRDPRSRVILFAPALIQSVIFGYAASFDLNHAPYAVLDEDRSAASRDLPPHLPGPGRLRQQLIGALHVAAGCVEQHTLKVGNTGSSQRSELALHRCGATADSHTARPCAAGAVQRRTCRR